MSELEKETVVVDSAAETVEGNKKGGEKDEKDEDNKVVNEAHVQKPADVNDELQSSQEGNNTEAEDSNIANKEILKDKELKKVLTDSADETVEDNTVAEINKTESVQKCEVVTESGSTKSEAVETTEKDLTTQFDPSDHSKGTVEGPAKELEAADRTCIEQAEVAAKANKNQRTLKEQIETEEKQKQAKEAVKNVTDEESCKEKIVSDEKQDSSDKTTTDNLDNSEATDEDLNKNDIRKDDVTIEKDGVISENLKDLKESTKASLAEDEKTITIDDDTLLEETSTIKVQEAENKSAEKDKNITKELPKTEELIQQDELKIDSADTCEIDQKIHEKNTMEQAKDNEESTNIDEQNVPQVSKEDAAEKMQPLNDPATKKAAESETNEVLIESPQTSKQPFEKNELVDDGKKVDETKISEKNIENPSTADITEKSDIFSVNLIDDTSESQDSKKLIIDDVDEKEKVITPTKDLTEPNVSISIEGEVEKKTTNASSEDDVSMGDTENDVQIIKDVTEVIEIDDDEEEVLPQTSLVSKPEENVSKYEDEATASSKEDPQKSCTETSTINEENNSDVSGYARMHTMPIIFYNKECINFECPKNNKEYHRSPQFALNYFKVVKKKIKTQYICGECYDTALNFYEDLCGVLNAKQPILLRDITSKKQEFVEILDSSDEENGSTNEVDNKEKENTSFSKADLNLIEAELENSIRSIFDRVEIQNQLTWSKTIFTERVQKLQDELEYVDAELREQQKMADKMYNNLYESGKYRINTLKPLDLDNESADQIPSYGEIERPAIKIGELYYAAKHKAIACWMPCRAVEQLDGTHMGSQKNVPNYRVKFISSQYQTYKNLSAKLIAYYDPPTVRLLVGQRVIAYFDGTTLSPRDKDKSVVQSAFYPGIIAEEMKPNNFFRYLIFYDDGYTQYVSHKDVRLVCHVARNVWEDVDQSSREFIQKYIMEYRVNRPMVQTHKGQKMATESNGRWVPARVIDIDCSLVRMQFEGPNKNHKEWIYRGSLRLNPVYMEYQKSKTRQTSQMPISRLPRRTEPFIRYTEDEESIRGSLGGQQRNANRADTTAAANQAPKVRHLNANTIYLEDESKPKGKVIYYTAKRQLPTKTYIPHKCGPACLIVVPHNLNGYSPLAKPLLSGWERIFLRQKSKKRVFYRAPCGKSFRDMKEVHQYLRLTKNTLNVDSFDFYPETSCLAEFEAENINLRKRDISNGQEKMPLPLVNYYDETLPECTYSAKVIPTEGVHINTNPDFLICCDCEDDCVDKEKCACWKLTIEGVRSINPDAHIDDIGYQYKRLYDHLPTGIYECNSRCKCKSHCINRVVQHSLEMKLQVFKTPNRGWGLRCLNDVPRGSFVCIYAGNLLTESKANEGGLDAGDEYFAELDYIETVEQLKEGYESDVELQEDEDDEEPYLPDDDDDFRPGKSFMSRSKRAQRQFSGEGERQAINFNPKVAMEDDSKKKRPSVRQFFGKDEAVYVMDAKVTGNLGRYFNHSCSPNLFVQNVFVDTHDVRFPWVAFFSLTHIRAGTELTWNYNYEVGVVPGKVLYCQCGAPNCRQRLL